MYVDPNYFPPSIPGIGDRVNTAFALCEECKEGTFQAYGGRALCPQCARRLAHYAEMNSRLHEEQATKPPTKAE